MSSCNNSYFFYMFCFPRSDRADHPAPVELYTHSSSRSCTDIACFTWYVESREKKPLNLMLCFSVIIFSCLKPSVTNVFPLITCRGQCVRQYRPAQLSTWIHQQQHLSVHPSFIHPFCPPSFLSSPLALFPPPPRAPNTEKKRKEKKNLCPRRQPSAFPFSSV